MQAAAGPRADQTFRVTGRHSFRVTRSESLVPSHGPVISMKLPAAGPRADQMFHVATRSVVSTSGFPLSACAGYLHTHRRKHLTYG